jgi:8-oxo-dGTP pyrophosphatase MutT (NUDIX family)
MTPLIKRISIAIVIAQERYLVGVRGPQSSFAGYDEFPGGKCLPDESSRDCAIRETAEETGLKIIPLELVYQHEQKNHYTGIQLDFWKAKLLDHDGHLHALPDPLPPFSWITKLELLERKFPSANTTIIKLINEDLI